MHLSRCHALYQASLCGLYVLAQDRDDPGRGHGADGGGSGSRPLLWQRTRQGGGEGSPGGPLAGEWASAQVAEARLPTRERSSTTVLEPDLGEAGMGVCADLLLGHPADGLSNGGAPEGTDETRNFTLGAYSKASFIGLTKETLHFPNVARLLNTFLQHVAPGHSWTSLAVHVNYELPVHKDLGSGPRPNAVVALSHFEGGRAVAGGQFGARLSRRPAWPTSGHGLFVTWRHHLFPLPCCGSLYSEIDSL